MFYLGVMGILRRDELGEGADIVGDGGGRVGGDFADNVGGGMAGPLKQCHDLVPAPCPMAKPMYHNEVHEWV